MLTTADTISSGGDSPAFAVALSTGQVAVVNYNGANGRVVPTTSPLQFADSAAPIITFPPPAGGVSHPHMVLEYGKELLVPDLVRSRRCVPVCLVILMPKFLPHFRVLILSGASRKMVGPATGKSRALSLNQQEAVLVT